MLLYSRFWGAAAFSFTALFKAASREYSKIAIKASALPASKRPSFYLLTSSLFLLVSGALSLTQPLPEEENIPKELQNRGWSQTEHLECQSLEPGSYYSLESESTTVEAYVNKRGKLFVSRLPLPDSPYSCQKVSSPLFVEEI